MKETEKCVRPLMDCLIECFTAHHHKILSIWKLNYSEVVGWPSHGKSANKGHH